MEKNKEINEVLSFLNTWEIPNTDRIPKDHFGTISDVSNYIHEHLTIEDSDDLLDEVILFRSDIRTTIEKNDGELINEWINRRQITYEVQIQNNKPVYNLIYKYKRKSLIDYILIDILTLINTGTFHRLKICPDCKWAFYDQSKSGTKKWCNMNANSPTGRACGTISKVKRYREKNRNK
ncbi:CGNR zinc finger domain-containing protein [Bacillus sp. SCS-151]|uniref:CGNR zinc finger domain-containing protein n=1 Tax=Nanhaiella sioensis TaxID=3115293 RepID=UPI00397C91C2